MAHRVTFRLSTLSPGHHKITWNIGLGPDGKYRRKYESYRGRKEDAKVRGSAVAAEYNKGLRVAATDESVKGFMERWLAEDVRVRLSEKTASDYEGYLRNHVWPVVIGVPPGDVVLGNVPVAELASAHLASLWPTLLDKGLSARTVVIIHAVVHSCLAWGVELKYLVENVAGVKAARPPRSKRKEVVPLDAPELASLLEAARGHQDFALWATLAYSGLRPGEALALHVDDLDLERLWLTVRYWVKRTGSSSYALREPKTERSRRRISIPAELAGVLRVHLATVADHARAMGGAFTDTGLVFPAPDGCLQKSYNTQKRWRRFAADQGHPGLKPYTLRHTHFSLLALGGTHPRVAADRSGSSVRTTSETYTHSYDRADREASDAISRLLTLAAASREEGRLALPAGESIERRVGRRLRYARQTMEPRGLTMDEVAHLAGFHKSALSQLERGVGSGYRAKLGRLAAVLGRPVEWFLVDEEPEGCPVRLADMRSRVDRRERPVYENPPLPPAK